MTAIVLTPGMYKIDVQCKGADGRTMDHIYNDKGECVFAAHSLTDIYTVLHANHCYSPLDNFKNWNRFIAKPRPSVWQDVLTMVNPDDLDLALRLLQIKFQERGDIETARLVYQIRVEMDDWQLTRLQQNAAAERGVKMLFDYWDL